MKIANRWRAMLAQIKKDKRAYAVFATLFLLIVAVIVRNAWLGRMENVFTGVLAALLLFVPPIVERRLHVDLPTTLEILAYLFVFAAEILGEIGKFYVHFPFWDTMLHTFNGFMFAAFGFCLVDIFNKTKRFRFQLSPVFLAIVAFCFSMTIGVLWEFFEFGADVLLHTDMQKDTVVTAIHSVSLPNDLGQKVTHVADIVSTTLVTAAGEVIVINGYLDIGIADTVKDMFVNFIGAVVFSAIGYFYVKHRGKGKLAEQFVPVFVGAEEQAPADGENNGQASEDRL